MYRKKAISKNVTEICTFASFTHVRQTCYDYLFFSCIFKKLFQWIWNQHEILRFLIPFIDFFQKNFFQCHICTFFELWSQTRKKRRQKSKNVFKVPKRENFSLAFFAQSEPTWVCDLRSGKKIEFFIKWPLFSMVFGFLPHTECAVSPKKIWS